MPKKPFVSLAESYPEIAAEADGWEPDKYSSGSQFKANWKCKFGHSWAATIKDRTKGSSCPKCSGRVSIKGVNDLQTKFPEVAKDAYGWDPSEFLPQSHKSKTWKCPNGHIYEAKIVNKINQKQGCKVCNNITKVTGFNDLLTSHPSIASEAYLWNPANSDYRDRDKKAWKCSIGHIYEAKIGGRKNGTGCPYCSGTSVLQGFNDLNTTHPDLVSEAIGWDTSKYSAGSEVRKKWKCTNGHTWITMIKARALTGTGCPSCAKSGFDPNNDGYLYFLSHEDWQMLQIGITNYPENRLKSHQKLGWEVIEVRGPMDGLLTQNWETSILRMLKAKGADLANSKIAGKFDGYSEAWSKNKFQVNSIKQLMELTEEFEKTNIKN